MLAALGAFVAVVAVGFVALGGPVDVTAPRLEDGRLTGGGISMPPEYAALLCALVVYTASHIAEIVRGSIQAVAEGPGRGGHRAGAVAGRSACGSSCCRRRCASPSRRSRNQYLNLTKNSSLAVAISYFELTKVTQVIDRQPGAGGAVLRPAAGPLPRAVAAAIAAVANVVNRRLALVER